MFLYEFSVYAERRNKNKAISEIEILVIQLNNAEIIAEFKNKVYNHLLSYAHVKSK